MQLLQTLAQKPRPLGSAQHMAIRDTLVRRLEKLGFATEIQNAVVTGPGNNPVIRISNIIAHRKGKENSKPLLLMAHYDAVPGSYGASDAGSAVAAIFETLRALQHLPPLKNDLIVLITDGEELGLVGARAFVQHHPLAKDIGLVLNFEARGSRGTSLLFETNANNGRLIREFIQAAPYPAGNSLAIEVYKFMPNDTDFSVFKRAGIQGLNFAYIDGHQHYHTPQDNLDTIDEGSLQHHGSYALALTTHFGNMDLRRLDAPDHVYFTPWRNFMVVYSNGQALMLVLVAMFIFLVGVRLIFEKELLTTKGILTGFLAVFLSMLIAAGVFFLIQMLIQSLFPWPHFRALLYVEKTTLAGAVLVIFAISGFIYTGFTHQQGVWNITTGALIVWSVLTILSAWYFPGASFLFLWPFIFSALGMALSFLLKCELQSGWKSALILFFTAFPVVVMLSPLVYMMLLSLTIRTLPVIMVLCALFISLLIPHLHLLIGTKRSPLLFGGMAAAGLLIIGMTLYQAHENPQYPRRVDILHVTDLNSGESFWATNSDTPESVLTFFVGSEPQEKPQSVIAPTYNGVLRTAASTPPPDLPTFAAVRDSIGNGRRYTTLRFTPGKIPGILSLYVPADTIALAMHFTDRSIDLQQGNGAYNAEGWRWMVYYNVPPEGLEFIIESRAGHTTEVRMRHVLYAFPQGIAPADRFAPETVPTPYVVSPRTIFRKAIAISAAEKGKLRMPD